MNKLLCFLGLLISLSTQAQNPVTQPNPYIFKQWISVGSYTTAGLPLASACPRCVAYNSDSSNFGFSNGSSWRYYGNGGGGALSANWGQIRDTITKQTDLMNLFNQKIGVTDTAGMLATYQRAVTAMKYSDTAGMLAPYLRSIFFTPAGIGLGQVLNRPQVINAGGWDSVGKGTFAGIPSPTTGPTFYYATDSNALYYTNRTSYVKVSGGSGTGGSGADSSIFVTRTYGAGHYYPLSGNPSNFLTSITGTMVNTALGYTAYSAANPANFISGNQTITLTPAGDVKGAASGSTIINPTDTVIGIRGAVIPALTNGILRNTSGTFAWDNNTYLTAASISGKVNVTDTAAMLAAYLRKQDTAAMLATYLRSTVAASTYATITADGLKLLKTDTAAMLAAYLRKQDTLAMLAPYLRSNTAASTYATITNLALKLNLSDTAGMLAHYTRTNDSRLTTTLAFVPAPTNVGLSVSNGTSNALAIATSTNAGAMGPSDRKFRDSLTTMSDSVRLYFRSDSLFLCTYDFRTATETCKLMDTIPAGAAGGLGSLHGDGHTIGTGAATFVLENVNSNTGSFGDSTHVAVATYNSKGLVLSVRNVAIAGSRTDLNAVPAAASMQITSSTGNPAIMNSPTRTASGIMPGWMWSRLTDTTLAIVNGKVSGGDTAAYSKISTVAGIADSVILRSHLYIGRNNINIRDSSVANAIIKIFTLDTTGLHIPGYTAENVANKSTTVTLGSSNTLYPTQGAVKSYSDSGTSTLKNKSISGLVNTFTNIPANTAMVGLLPAVNGGLGANGLNGYLFANGASAATASNTIPGSAVSGSISGNAGNVTGIVDIAHGGHGQTTAAAGLLALGGAPLASPSFTGTPLAPTASPGTATTQIATTGFVNAAITGIGATNFWTLSGSDIFNNNTGNVGIGTGGAASQFFHVKKVQNASTVGLIQNTNTGTSSGVAWIADNGTADMEIGIAGVNRTPNGILLSNAAFLYTASAAGMALAINGNAPMVFGNGTSMTERFRMSTAGNLVLNNAGVDNGTKFQLNGGFWQNKDSIAQSTAGSVVVDGTDTATGRKVRFPLNFFAPLSGVALQSAHDSTTLIANTRYVDRAVAAGVLGGSVNLGNFNLTLTGDRILFGNNKSLSLGTFGGGTNALNSFSVYAGGGISLNGPVGVSGDLAMGGHFFGPSGNPSSATLGTNVSSITFSTNANDFDMTVIVVTSGAVSGTIGTINPVVLYTTQPVPVISCADFTTANATTRIALAGTFAGGGYHLSMTGTITGAGTWTYNIHVAQ